MGEAVKAFGDAFSDSDSEPGTANPSSKLTTRANGRKLRSKSPKGRNLAGRVAQGLQKLQKKVTATSEAAKAAAATSADDDDLATVDGANAAELAPGAAQQDGNGDELVQLPKVPPGPVPAGQQQDQVVGGNDQQKGPDYGWNYPLVWSNTDLNNVNTLLGADLNDEVLAALFEASRECGDTLPGP